MRFQVTFYRDGHPAATVEVDAPTEGQAVTTALADGRIPDRDRVFDGPWTATVDRIAAT